MTGEFPEWLVKFEHWLEYEVQPRIESTLEAIQEWNEQADPPKPDIQEVREWLWPERDYGKPQYGDPYPMGKAELWDIEEALAEHTMSIWMRRPRLLDGQWQYKVTRAAGIVEVEHTFSAATKGEALLKAAKWLMKQEGSDGCR